MVYPSKVSRHATSLNLWNSDHVNAAAARGPTYTTTLELGKFLLTFPAGFLISLGTWSDSKREIGRQCAFVHKRRSSPFPVTTARCIDLVPRGHNCTLFKVSRNSSTYTICYQIH